MQHIENNNACESFRFSIGKVEYTMIHSQCTMKHSQRTMKHPQCTIKHPHYIRIYLTELSMNHGLRDLFM